MPRIRTGSIHVIESLRQGDLRTGERLRDQIEPLALSSHPAIAVHFWREHGRDEFLRRLAHILDDVRTARLAPVVHIETHGDSRGLQLTSLEHVTWSDLKEPLTAINVMCRLNLLVVLGACDGAGLLAVVQATDRAPVWGLIGPKRLVTAGEVDDANGAFYRTLFASRDGGAAWRAMNAAVQAGDSPFGLFGAEAMFRLIVHRYFSERCSEEQLRERTDRATETAKDWGLPPDGLRQFRERFANYVRDHRARFEELYRQFFFVDLCPEHASRFEVSFEECFGADGRDLEAV